MRLYDTKFCSFFTSPLSKDLNPIDFIVKVQIWSFPSFQEMESHKIMHAMIPEIKGQ